MSCVGGASYKWFEASTFLLDASRNIHIVCIWGQYAFIVVLTML